jgi:hypothetical protein
MRGILAEHFTDGDGMVQRSGALLVRTTVRYRTDLRAGVNDLISPIQTGYTPETLRIHSALGVLISRGAWGSLLRFYGSPGPLL